MAPLVTAGHGVKGFFAMAGGSIMEGGGTMTSPAIAGVGKASLQSLVRVMDWAGWPMDRWSR